MSLAYTYRACGVGLQSDMISCSFSAVQDFVFAHDSQEEELMLQQVKKKKPFYLDSYQKLVSW